MELTETTSSLSTPEQAPLPYLIEKGSPFFLYVDDLSLWYLLWSTKDNSYSKVNFLSLLSLSLNYKNEKTAAKIMIKYMVCKLKTPLIIYSTAKDKDTLKT